MVGTIAQMSFKWITYFMWRVLDRCGSLLCFQIISPGMKSLLFDQGVMRTIGALVFSAFCSWARASVLQGGAWWKKESLRSQLCIPGVELLQSRPGQGWDGEWEVLVILSWEGIGREEIIAQVVPTCFFVVVLLKFSRFPWINVSLLAAYN